MKENDMRFQLDNFLLHPDNFITYNQKIDIYAEINKCVGYLSEILKNHPMDFYRYVSSLDSKYSEPDKKTHDTHSMKQVKHLINIVKFIPPKYNINENEIIEMQKGVLNHDLGKGIEPIMGFVNNNGYLGQAEFLFVQQHPVIGYLIVKELGKIEIDDEFKDGSNDFYIDLLKRLDEGWKEIVFHHERNDGKGYPLRLKGDKIPIGAQIASVGDAHDAIVHNRIYDEADSLFFAEEDLKRCSNQTFKKDKLRIYNIKKIENMKKRYEKKFIPKLIEHIERNTRFEISRSELPCSEERLIEKYLELRTTAEDQFNPEMVEAYLKGLKIKIT